MKLSIIIPCYNENRHISALVSRVKEARIEDKQIIIVDDFSKDGTREKLRSEIESKVDKVIYHPRNMGKGKAIQSALDHVTGDIVIIQDADLEYDPSEYPKLMAPILEGKADVVYGSRFIGGEPHRVHLFWHYLGNKFLTLLSNIFTSLKLTDRDNQRDKIKRK
jgi:glycosyltransferase involved in cell wall biosynthesis